MKKNQHYYTILSHIATWCVLFLLPLMFRKLEYPIILLPSIIVIILFYFNYFWLTPRFYMNGRKVFCWGVNAVLVVAVAFCMHHWLNVGLGYLFNLAVAVIISISMRLGSIWQQSEEARLAAEAARMDAELSNLRYQTNPHFLLNTLNNIYALTTFNIPKAQESIQQLSVMLQHILYDSQEQEVGLDSEIKFLESYISLMKIRLADSVDVSLQTTLIDSNLRIAPLILVPLVENAFKHGVSPSSPSFIHMTLSADKSQIIFSIENSNHPKSNQDKSGHGIGLEQVRKRLELTYAGRYQWDYGTSSDGLVYRSKIVINF